MTNASRAELRAELLSCVQPWYSPALHVLGPAVAVLGATGLAFARIHDLRAWQLGFVPIFLVALNALEWHAHRGVLHRRFRLLEPLYEQHTPQHHALYVPGQLAIHSFREVRFVLLPAYAFVAAALAASPVALALLWLGQPNLAALWVASGAVYLVAYEWTHLACHLPESSPIARLATVRRLRRHHELHHAPQLMQRWNFNVTVPLWDLLRGTALQARPGHAGATAFEGAQTAPLPRRAP